MSLNNGQYVTTGPEFSAASTAYVACRFKLNTAYPSGTIGFIVLYNGSTTLATYYIRSDGKLQAGSTQSSTSVITVGSETYLKVRYTAGTGSNGIATIYTSSNGSSWTQQATDTALTATLGVTKIRLSSNSAGASPVFIFDTLRVSSSDINL
jgi:hypothetical protein